MTWIRLDCELPNHPVIGLLAQELRVDTDRALACYCRTLLGFGEHRVDGRVGAVADVTLEEWAKWRGRAGRWATAFRSLCVEMREGERDQPGVIKGWWRQLKLLEKQERDRLRPGEGTRKASERPAGASQVPLGGNDNDDENENGYGKQSSLAGERENEPLSGPVDRIAYAQRCTIACNRGLRDNPKINGFRELATSNQMEITDEWLGHGTPVELAEQVVYDRAMSYTPRGSNRQPASLSYFSRVLQQEWEVEQSRRLEPGFQPRTRESTEALDEYEAAARRLEEQERAHAS